MTPVSPHLARVGGYARPAGGPGVAGARASCTEVLRALGFAVSERSFEYSRVPGAWATPVVGVILPLVGTALAVWRHTAVAWILAAVVLVVGGPLAAYVGRAGVLDLPLLRRTGVNLEATRGGASPAVWLVAHLDSKWQPVSMITRVAGVIVSAVAMAGVLLVALGPFAASDRTTTMLLMLQWLGAMPLMLSVVGAQNHGTLDNASGVAAVLEAAALVPRHAPIGILITDAEELALAGARAWARSRPPGVALNCDSIDDDGRLTVMYSNAAPSRLITHLEAAATAHGESLRVMRLIPGILTDSVALADAGWETLTLSRGNLRTLQRIHTSRDSLDAMRGTGIAITAQILARTATEIS